MLKILYATDGSAGALNAARFLSSLPHQENVRLHLLTICPPAESDNPKNNEGRDTLDTTQSMLSTFMGNITRSIRYAENGTQHIIDTILDEATCTKTDLIVLGICGRSALSRFFIGSVAEGVAHNAPCPVLLAGPVVGTAFDRILIGFDGSSNAVKAAEWLPHLPLSEGSLIRLLSVVLPHPTFPGGAGILLLASGIDVDNLVDRDKERISVAQAAMVRRLREKGITARIITEIHEDREAATALIDSARENQTDLIVVGSQGTTQIENILLGSVSKYILYHTPCSILIVRSSQTE